ncbi:oxidoreductase-like domain-containing protein [Neisseria leonii]|uniref:Oxidoreductase-like domain-containing protein n=1 Tax=Neisseria leonii TaxID=2995413 RepID=A0A9X4E3P9_9NEIS|nr:MULTISPECIES: oxidoreductase-like domain-containing protein [unclassified Neisseria]MDD9325999.1 hypothetical protein [Neisseria sp. 3986]MDD9328144.1 hypothetical protein [Neisseria sp. 51.81]
MIPKAEQARLAALLGETLLEEPEAPADWECCGSECGDACIQTIYSNSRAAYLAQQNRLKQLAENKQAV